MPYLCSRNLATNWQDELLSKFHLDFNIMTNDQLEATGGNWFQDNHLVICRLDKMSRDEDLQEQFKFSDWDLVIVDEAHKMSASIWNNEIKETKRHKLGKLLGQRSRHFLLMTATPHNGKDEDFQLFMGLLDGDRFEGRYRDSVHVSDPKDLYRKTFKEDMLTFEGKKLFPKRHASSINYELSQAEADLYNDVTEYVREQFNRAESLGNDKRKGTVGFALTVLQRRLASSPEAIYQSLMRRRKRLEDRLKEEELRKRSENSPLKDTDKLSFTKAEPSYSEDDLEDLEDSPSEELEEKEEEIVDQATAAQTVAELKVEIGALKGLEQTAKEVRHSNQDKKWEQLRSLLHDDESMHDKTGRRRKLIIFTEHKDTLNYLEEKIKSFLGKQEAVITIRGGMHRNERKNAENAFNQDAKVEILIATDAACEGVNLHHNCHLMINYDLPWNPNRMEQRFGRVHRIGQKEECHLWNLVARETREGNVFDTLFTKLENVRATLGDRVFDVLGEVFQGAELRKLLMEAVRSGKRLEDNPELEKKLAGTLNIEHIKKLLEERALGATHMAQADVNEIKLRMERAEARKLQPHYISSFFVSALTDLGGKIKETEPGRYQVVHVPIQVRRRDRIMGSRAALREDYTRITFQKELAQVEDGPGAEYVCPGHPLLDCTRELIEDHYGNLLRQGSVLIDEEDYGTEPRVLVFLEHAILDGRRDRKGNFRTVSKQMQFVEIFPDGRYQLAGHAPYLDYKPATIDQTAKLKDLFSEDWLTQDFESKAKKVAIEELVNPHFKEVKDRKLHYVEKTKEEVHRRLTQEINFWDKEYKRTLEKEEAGKKVKRSSSYCKKKANDLDARLHKRLKELEEESELRNEPPMLLGATLVVPVGYLKKQEGTWTKEFAADAEARKRIEMIAMREVTKVEESLGYVISDVSKKNKGWDLESVHKENRNIRLIEVKGRVAGAPTVTITKNEILAGKNNPDNFILAIVEVDGDSGKTVYIRRAFENTELSSIGFEVTSINFDLSDLKQKAEEPK
jgi:superfamily II DNA or RNA helicase